MSQKEEMDFLFYRENLINSVLLLCNNPVVFLSESGETVTSPEVFQSCKGFRCPVSVDCDKRNLLGFWENSVLWKGKDLFFLMQGFQSMSVARLQ